MKLRLWCDSGANAFSRYEQFVYTEDYGLTDDEWNAMSDDDKWEMVKDDCMNRLDMGYIEV